MDFGLARRQSAPPLGDETALWELAPSGGVAGTPAYMAPEQARGERATAASDVFALGLILFEMATGRRARSGGSLLQWLRQLEESDPAGYAAQTPEPFAAVLRRTLAADPAARRLSAPSPTCGLNALEGSAPRPCRDTPSSAKTRCVRRPLARGLPEWWWRLGNEPNRYLVRGVQSGCVPPSPS
jgi:serine/threonine protein kinase